MPEVTSSQLTLMDECLNDVMNFRLRLTKKPATNSEETIESEDSEVSEGSQSESSDDSQDSSADSESSENLGIQIKVVSKYDPPLRFKGFFLSVIFCSN